MYATATVTTGADAYGVAGRALGTPRSIELQAFSRVTGQLSAAARKDAPFADLAAALHANHVLWSTLLADLANPDNELPQALRGQLVSLGLFTFNHGAKVLARTAEPQPLIDINTAIMRGLRGIADAGASMAPGTG